MRRRNSDESRRELERAVLASPDDVAAQTALLGLRLRSGDVLEVNVRAAACMGVPEAAAVVGISGLSPMKRRDDLLNTLKGLPREYAVLWAMACLESMVFKPDVDLATTPVEACLTYGASAAGQLSRYLKNPAPDNVGRCRNLAYHPPDYLNRICQTASYASLSASAEGLDFSRPDPNDDETGVAEGIFLLWLPLMRYTERRPRGRAPFLAASGVDLPALDAKGKLVHMLSADNILQTTQTAHDMASWPKIRVNLETAAAALALLTCVEWFSFQGPLRGITHVLEDVERAIAGPVREWLLTDRPLSVFGGVS